MNRMLTYPANVTVMGVQGYIVSFVIAFLGIILFVYILYKRLIPLLKANADPRFDRIGTRIKNVVRYWLFQYKHPRYKFAGILHIFIFAGFLILSVSTLDMIVVGFNEKFSFFELGGGGIGIAYNCIKNYASTIVLLACIIAGIRRCYFKEERYKVPAKYGKEHTAEALTVLCLIAGLMIFESLFSACLVVAQEQQVIQARFLPALTLAWFFSKILAGSSGSTIQSVSTLSYFAHDLIFFFFLCFLPFGKHFHVLTALPNVFFSKLDRGTIKPVKWGISEEDLDNLESIGVKYFEDFTWKNMLDFYSCVDCGRCSDNCPANAVGRPLSPRFITIKSRDYCFQHYPVFGKDLPTEELMGKIFEEDEIWSCTTCGACEEECPVMNKYINKIVDLRRSMVDQGNVPQSLQKALVSLEKRGNPYNETGSKNVDWTKCLSEDIPIKMLTREKTAAVLYFVDSVTSFDHSVQGIAKATVKILHQAGADFGLLGNLEKDSGHEVRRFGEELLFNELREQNTEAILNTGAKCIVTADPHAFNALKKDYSDLPPVEHISQFIARNLQTGKLKFRPIENNNLIFTYHDPCYLGRHNGLYDIPRKILDSIPGLKRVEMKKCRDRSFCCGGGGLMMFYEAIEDRRMGQDRVKMAEDTGANVIVTCCPFCKLNIEDGIKTSGLEGKMRVIDLTELVAENIV